MTFDLQNHLVLSSKEQGLSNDRQPKQDIWRWYFQNFDLWHFRFWALYLNSTLKSKITETNVDFKIFSFNWWSLISLFALQGGIYVLTLMDWYSGSYNLMIVSLCELVAVCYVYGKFISTSTIQTLFVAITSCGERSKRTKITKHLVINIFSKI